MLFLRKERLKKKKKTRDVDWFSVGEYFNRDCIRMRSDGIYPVYKIIALSNVVYFCS
jgi:hypothetical protein